MKRAETVIAGCQPLSGDPTIYLEEAYALLTTIVCAIGDDDQSRPTDGILRRAVDGAATLVALAFAGIEQ